MEDGNPSDDLRSSLWRLAPYTSMALGLGILAVIIKNRGLHVENPRLFYFIFLPVTAHIFHQFEEYAQPGGFRQFFNGIVSDKKMEEEPLTPAMGAVINSLLMPLFLGISGVIGLKYPWIGVTTVFVIYANGFFHITYAITRMKYNPGLVTSVVIMLPLGMSVAHVFSNNGDVTQPGLALAILVGTLLSGAPILHGRRLANEAMKSRSLGVQS